MGTKSSKNNTYNNQPLSAETIHELCEDTGFSEEELLAWHANFYKDCPDGKLTLKQFEQEYSKIMGKPTQKTADYVRHMFTVYDHDKNQFIDFKEFVMALSAASVVNRLRLVETLFHVFDLDNDGKITKEEIGTMLHTLVDVTNSNHKQYRRHHHLANQQENKKQIDVQKRIDDAFNELNTNDDDHITKDEFIEWYMKSGLISEVQSAEITVPDPSRIQQIEKKSRKLLKHTVTNKPNNEQEDNHRISYLMRHMSKMTERKSPSTIDEDNNNDNNNNNHQLRQQQPTTVSLTNTYNDNDNDIEIDNPRIRTHPTVYIQSNSDDNDSHYSNENERWQHLFNSVLGQIRAQRIREQQQEQQNGQNNAKNFTAWKREGEEKLKSEYLKQKTTYEQNRSYLSTKTNHLQPSTTVSDEAPPSPEVVSIRL